MSPPSLEELEGSLAKECGLSESEVGGVTPVSDCMAAWGTPGIVIVRHRHRPRLAESMASQWLYICVSPVDVTPCSHTLSHWQWWVLCICSGTSQPHHNIATP